MTNEASDSLTYDSPSGVDLRASKCTPEPSENGERGGRRTVAVRIRAPHSWGPLATGISNTRAGAARRSPASLTAWRVSRYSRACACHGVRESGATPRASPPPAALHRGRPGRAQAASLKREFLRKNDHSYGERSGARLPTPELGANAEERRRGAARIPKPAR